MTPMNVIPKTRENIWSFKYIFIEIKAGDIIKQE